MELHTPTKGKKKKDPKPRTRLEIKKKLNVKFIKNYNVNEKRALHLPLLLQMNNLSMPIPQGESSAQKPTHKTKKIK